MAENPSDAFRRLAGATPTEAKFFWTGGPIDVAERTWFQSFFSGCTGFETDDGLVLVDAGTVHHSERLAACLRSRSDAPIHTAVYTHGHVDHAYGLAAFLADDQAPPRVIAHRALPERIERYLRTPRHNAAINARQFGAVVDAGMQQFDIFTAPEYPPTELYQDSLTIEVGGVEFQLRHCRGETDDHTWVFCPSRGVLCTGDLVIWAVPNAGNPQKAQRYPWDWAAGLREMAECKARTLCPGHGGPIVDDAATVRRVLCETADYLDTIVDKTLQALEQDSPPHVDIVHQVPAPSSDSPWLAPVYDEAEFIVRNVIRYYGGWWSGRPCELKPAPRASVAREVAGLAGGAVALARRASALVAQGDVRLACHLADYALEAAPDDEEVRKAVVGVYERRAEEESSLMAINLFRSAAAYARDGRPFT